MNNFHKYIASIITVILLFFVFNELNSYLTGIKNEKAHLYLSDETIFKNLIHYQDENLEILAAVLTSDETIKEAYRTNNPELIKNHIGDLWQDVKKKKLTYEMHFFKPPAISFVNFSNFKSLGKDVGDVRSDILWITSSFKSSFHPLVCKTYAGYRVTTPIFENNGTLLGGLSLGKQLSWLPQTMKNRTHDNAFLVYTQESLSSLKSKYYESFMKDKQKINNLILADTTITIPLDTITHIDFNTSMQTFTVDDIEYSLNIYPIIGFNNNVIAYICTLGDLSHFKNIFYERLWDNLILILITAFSVFFISRFTTVKILKKVDSILRLNEKIKLRDFSALIKNKKTIDSPHDTLEILQNDIVEMGLTIEKKYSSLEEESKQKTQLLIEQLYTDSLTKLPNTNAIFHDINKDKEKYIAIFNIKSFKQLNDFYGFDIGNFILKEVAQKILNLITIQNCKLYKFGNDEYVLMNLFAMPKKSFEKIVSSTIKMVELNEFHYLDTQIHIDMYAGICFEGDEKLEKADVAQSDAKRQHLDYVIYADNQERQTFQYHNISMTKKIKHAIKNDDILVYFQAIVDKDENYFKYECLVRMRDGTTILSPYYFLDIATKTRYYHQISQIVIRTSFAFFKDKDKCFSVNLSINDILNKETLKLLYTQLDEFPDASRVVFELLESEEIYDVEDMRVFIANVKEMGAKIAIDDFGTGYSNFSYLLQMKPDYLKIDGSIVKNIDTDEKSKTIAKTIINFAHELNIKIVAEFVHSKEVYEVCKSLGVDEFQGYYLGEPQENI